jgi:uncharacterized protein
MKLHASAPSGAQVVTALRRRLRHGERRALRREHRAAAGSSAALGCAQLRIAHRSRFRRPAQAGAEILILGTGAKQRFPHPRLTAPLARSGIGLEVMSLQAACRTYNILVAEERKVAAALLFR